MTLKLITTLALILFAFYQPAQANPIKTLARQAIVIDETTGTVLFEKNADERMPTSSMSKVMTTYAVFDALKKGNIALNDTFLVSEKAWRKGGSKMFIEVGKHVKIEDLLRGVIIQSGNDATIALAEGLAGTEEAFAKGLTKKAQALGMNDSNFKNASGWPDPEHYSTARDLAKLASALIKSFPEYYKYFSEKTFTYNNIKQDNRNPLLYRDIGADGVKTGHTEVGGYGLIGSGVHNGRRVTIVINGLQSEKDRAQESAKLLDWGLKGFELKKLFAADTIIEYADVALGKEGNVALITNKDVVMTVPILPSEDITARVEMQSPVIAPIRAGQEIGTLIIKVPDLKEHRVPVFAAQDVEKQGFISSVFAKAKYLLSGA